MRDHAASAQQARLNLAEATIATDQRDQNIERVANAVIPENPMA